MDIFSLVIYMKNLKKKNEMKKSMCYHDKYSTYILEIELNYQKVLDFIEMECSIETVESIFQ